MEQIWWLHALVFLFGYLTCKVFYFLRATRLSVLLLRVSQLISLALLARAVENFSYAHSVRVMHMKKVGDSPHNINAFELNFATELEKFKRASIEELIALHPTFFADTVSFTDWDSAMTYLNKEGRTYVKHFIGRMG